MLQLFIYDPHKKRYWPQNPQNIEWKVNKWYGNVRMGGNPPYEATVIVALVPPSGQVMSAYYREMGILSEKFKKDVGENSDAFVKFKARSIYWKAIPGELPKDFVKLGKVVLRRVK